MKIQRPKDSWLWWFFAGAILFAIASGRVEAQSFSSGSTGADGALNYTTPGTIVFDPTTIPNHQAGDNVFNFTTINIAVGVTVKLTARMVNAPIYWLATGDVTIAGTIRLDGEDGQPVTGFSGLSPAMPGSGGYVGGSGGYSNGQYSVAPQDGGGPARGQTCLNAYSNTDGGLGENQYLVPLFGGSGGAGYSGFSGGAGGGALLIASSTTITINGQISANGGRPGSNAPCNSDHAVAGGGAGGSIRLAASAIAGTGQLSANAGGRSGAGIVRLEAFQRTFIGQILGVTYLAAPFGVFLPPPFSPGSIQITNIGGVAVPPNPTGVYPPPDVTIPSGTNVPFTIQGTNVPVGTVVTLTLVSENGPPLSLNGQLMGSLTSSTVTITAATVPPGYSVSAVRANWTQ